MSVLADLETMAGRKNLPTHETLALFQTSKFQSEAFTTWKLARCVCASCMQDLEPQLI